MGQYFNGQSYFRFAAVYLDVLPKFSTGTYQQLFTSEIKYSC